MNEWLAWVLTGSFDLGEDGLVVGATVYTYGESEKSKAKQHSCITDKRENPHVVMGDVSMNAQG